MLGSAPAISHAKKFIYRSTGATVVAALTIQLDVELVTKALTLLSAEMCAILSPSEHLTGSGVVLLESTPLSSCEL